MPNAHYFEPTIQEKHGNSIVNYDIYSRLLKDRIIFMRTDFNPTVCNSIVAQLLYLNSVDDKAPIHFYINSPGGSISQGLAVYDVIGIIHAPVYTYAIGSVASMGAFMFSAGTKGHRYITENTEVMVHEPRIIGGGVSGTATDMAIDMEHMANCKKRMNRILAKNCGKSEGEMAAICSRDYWMYSGEDAIKFGIADKILPKSHIKV